MNIKQFFLNNRFHFLVIFIMLVLTVSYFNLQFSGYGLKQHDIAQYKGASKEIADYREQTGQHTLWTNSMFGGMPSIQISVIYTGNYIKRGFDAFMRMLPPPAGTVFLYMLGFYILMMCLKVNPWIGLLGSIAFAFSTYEIIIIQAGHNTKALAVAFMAPVVGSFIVAYHRSIKWGIILSAIFMTLEMSVNHLQVTYYLGMILVFLGIATLRSSYYKKKNSKNLV
jgi:hypothetical protein